MRLFYTFLFFICFSAIVSAQIEARTKDGREVILNNNGTWIYADSLCNYFTHIEKYADGRQVIFANNTVKVTGEHGKTGLEVMLMKTSQSVVFNISIIDPTVIWCTDKETRAVITFTDGKKMELSNMGDNNCKGNFSCFLGNLMGNKKELKQLSEKLIRSMSISYAINNSETTVTNTVETLFSKGEAFRVRTIMACLYDKQ